MAVQELTKEDLDRIIMLLNSTLTPAEEGETTIQKNKRLGAAFIRAADLYLETMYAVEAGFAEAEDGFSIWHEGGQLFVDTGSGED